MADVVAELGDTRRIWSRNRPDNLEDNFVEMLLQEDEAMLQPTEQALEARLTWRRQRQTT